jgi:hypothetical protein
VFLTDHHGLKLVPFVGSTEATADQSASVLSDRSTWNWRQRASKTRRLISN